MTRSSSAKPPSQRSRHRAGSPVVVALRLPAPGAGDPSYALDKLEKAVRILATQPASLRERLCAALYSLSTVSARDIPEALRPEFEAIRRQATKNPPRMQRSVRNGRVVEESTGAIAATVGYMRIKTLTRLAERIYDLTDRLRDEQ